MTDYCEIKIHGLLDEHWSNWFEDLSISYLENDKTLICGCLPDQAALHSLLERIRDLNLRLISVTCGRPANPYPTNGEYHENDANIH